MLEKQKSEKISTKKMVLFGILGIIAYFAFDLLGQYLFN